MEGQEIVELNPEDNNPDDNNSNVVIAPLPPATPPATPVSSGMGMPSALPTEAWRNVEELLVTLSNNLRVAVGNLRDDIATMSEESLRTNREIMSVLNEMRITLGEFKTILANATVEVETPKQDQQEQPKKKSGFLGRRGK